MRSDLPPLAVLVRRQREARGWSRARLAKEAGLSASTIKNVEFAHPHVTTVATLAALARALDLPELALQADGPLALAVVLRRYDVVTIAQALRLADVDIGALARGLRANQRSTP